MVCARLWSGFGALAESCGSPTWDLATNSLYALKHPQKRVLHEPQPKRLLFLNSGGDPHARVAPALGIAIVVAGIPQAAQTCGSRAETLAPRLRRCTGSKHGLLCRCGLTPAHQTASCFSPF